MARTCTYILHKGFFMYLKDEHAFNHPHYVRYIISRCIPSLKDYGYDVVGIRDMWVMDAHKQHKLFVVQSPNGEYIYSPEWIMHNVKTYPLEKKIPGIPMYFYSLMIPHSNKSPDERWDY